MDTGAIFIVPLIVFGALVDVRLSEKRDIGGGEGDLRSAKAVTGVTQGRVSGRMVMTVTHARSGPRQDEGVPNAGRAII